MLNHKGTKKLTTERLILRKFKVEDHKDFYLCCSDPSVNRYLTYSIHQNENDTKEIIEKWIAYYENDATYNWAIEYYGKVIGSISVVSQNETECGLGWQLGKEYWNKGIMTEAAKAVTNYLFEVGFEKISASHHIDNIGSGKVMQKIGMTKEKEIPNVVFKKNGEICTQICYTIKKE